MPEPRHNLNRASANPPSGSRLAAIFAHFSDLSHGEPSLSEQPDEVFVPTVTDWLLEVGVPAGKALEAVLPYIVFAHKRIYADMEAEVRDRKRKAGNPGGVPLIVGFIFAEFIRQKLLAPNAAKKTALYEATAVALGPGISGRHVRSAVERVNRLPRAQWGAFVATSFELAALIAEFDQARPRKLTRR